MAIKFVPVCVSDTNLPAIFKKSILRASGDTRNLKYFVLFLGLMCRGQRNLCVHDLSPVSNKDCEADRIPDNLSPILSDLRHIVKEKKRKNGGGGQR